MEITSFKLKNELLDLIKLFIIATGTNNKDRTVEVLNAQAKYVRKDITRHRIGPATLLTIWQLSSLP